MFKYILLSFSYFFFYQNNTSNGNLNTSGNYGTAV